MMLWMQLSIMKDSIINFTLLLLFVYVILYLASILNTSRGYAWIRFSYIVLYYSIKGGLQLIKCSVIFFSLITRLLIMLIKFGTEMSASASGYLSGLLSAKILTLRSDDVVHDHCCMDRVTQDVPDQDANILTPRADVDKYLQKFSNLKVESIVENSHARPGGALFAKFKNKYLSLPKHQQTTQLAFHGTAEDNIQSICSDGFDSSRRNVQAHGAGEYFAVTPDISLGYCKYGKKLLLNELLLGQEGIHHTRHGDIIVMKNPAHDLPRFIITFK